MWPKLKALKKQTQCKNLCNLFRELRKYFLNLSLIISLKNYEIRCRSHGHMTTKFNSIFCNTQGESWESIKYIKFSVFELVKNTVFFKCQNLPPGEYKARNLKDLGGNLKSPIVTFKWVHSQSISNLFVVLNNNSISTRLKT